MKKSIFTSIDICDGITLRRMPTVITFCVWTALPMALRKISCHFHSLLTFGFVIVSTVF